jgi:hypothetical protein
MTIGTATANSGAAAHATQQTPSLLKTKCLNMSQPVEQQHWDIIVLKMPNNYLQT